MKSSFAPAITVHDLEPRILEETEHMLALYKPSGLITHRDGRTEEPSVAEWLLARYPELARVCPPWVSPQGEAVPLAGLVHRLDRVTSGILIAAKTPEAYRLLKEEFRARRVEKKYLAYVEGQVKEEKGRIVAEIARTSAPPRKWYARPTTEEDVRAAITDWRVLKRADAATLLEVFPRTGRTHQIRVHLASIGHPLMGDERYGLPAQAGAAPGPIYLHAASITLALPSGHRTTFEAPLPPDFPN